MGACFLSHGKANVRRSTMSEQRVRDLTMPARRGLIGGCEAAHNDGLPPEAATGSTRRIAFFPEDA